MLTHKMPFAALPIACFLASAQACPLTPQLQSIIERHEQAQNIPKRLLLALIQKESSFCPTAVSRVGAIGLGQLMPDTAAQLNVDPYDVAENVKGSAIYFARLYRAFGDWSLALAAYNAGPGNVIRYGGIPPFIETQQYVVRVKSIYQQYGGQEARVLGQTLQVIPASTSAAPAVQTRMPALPPGPSAAPAPMPAGLTVQHNGQTVIFTNPGR